MSLQLVYSADAPPPAELLLLPPAEAEQAAREPYVADWMVREGHAAFRSRRVARRRRWLSAILVIVSLASAAATLLHR